MGPLDTATLDELIDEIKRRSINSLIYLEGVGKDLQYMVRYRGDLIRLHGAMELRVIPYLQDQYDEMMGDDGDDE